MRYDLKEILFQTIRSARNYKNLPMKYLIRLSKLFPTQRSCLVDSQIYVGILTQLKLQIFLSKSLLSEPVLPFTYSFWKIYVLTCPFLRPNPFQSCSYTFYTYESHETLFHSFSHDSRRVKGGGGRLPQGSPG